MFPLDLSLSDSFAKLLVLLPCSGHHTDKATMPNGDLLKIFLRGQFAVCDIDEVGSPKKLLQCSVVCGMDSVIGLIAIVDPV